MFLIAIDNEEGRKKDTKRYQNEWKRVSEKKGKKFYIFLHITTTEWKVFFFFHSSSFALLLYFIWTNFRSSSFFCAPNLKRQTFPLQNNIKKFFASFSSWVQRREKVTRMIPREDMKVIFSVLLQWKWKSMLYKLKKKWMRVFLQIVYLFMIFL